jgi:hypothetical protein
MPADTMRYGGQFLQDLIGKYAGAVFACLSRRRSPTRANLLTLRARAGAAAHGSRHPLMRWAGLQMSRLGMGD